MKGGIGELRGEGWYWGVERGNGGIGEFRVGGGIVELRGDGGTGELIGEEWNWGVERGMGELGSLELDRVR